MAIIGGGVQGLVILDALIGAGYSCALVTEGDVGAGQTLHSHGLLNTGFGMSDPALPRAAVEIVYPFFRDRGIELSDAWIVLPMPEFPALTTLPPTNLPVGFSPAFSETALQLPARSFNKLRMMETLTRDLQDRIIRGSVLGFRGRQPVEAVQVQPAGSSTAIEVQSRVVVVAAGCGSKRLLRELVGVTSQTEMIKHRLVHMVCLRAQARALPATSVVALPLALLVAAHQDSEGVTWYVTPMEMGGPSFDDVPNDAAADVYSEMLARACSALLALYPALADTDGLVVGQYAGYRQDIGDMPAQRMCEVVEGSVNVIAALPSGLVAPWLNATDALGLVRGLAEPGGTPTPLPAGGHGVRVGRAVEDRPGFVWTPWDEWVQSLPQTGSPTPG